MKVPMWKTEELDLFAIGLMVHDCSPRTDYSRELSNETSWFPLFVLC